MGGTCDFIYTPRHVKYKRQTRNRRYIYEKRGQCHTTPPKRRRQGRAVDDAFLQRLLLSAYCAQCTPVSSRATLLHPQAAGPRLAPPSHSFFDNFSAFSSPIIRPSPSPILLNISFKSFIAHRHSESPLILTYLHRQTISRHHRTYLVMLEYHHRCPNPHLFSSTALHPSSSTDAFLPCVFNTMSAM